MVNQKTILLLVAAVALVASPCFAQDTAAADMVTADTIDAMNATEMNATAADATEMNTPAVTEFPEFNYTTIFPGGMFDAAAYSNWLGEVSTFYQGIYEMYAGEGAQALEALYGGFSMPATGAIGGFGGFQMPNFGGLGWYPGQFANQWAQGAEAVASSLTG